MKINIQNTDKLSKAIADAQGKATARTITAGGICHILDKIKVPKNRLNGTMVHYDGGEHFPNAYKYRPESTHWIAENINGKWYVVDIYRDTCPNRNGWSGEIKYSDPAKEWIIENMSKIS